jgi:hypothetical protein
MDSENELIHIITNHILKRHKNKRILSFFTIKVKEKILLFHKMFLTLNLMLKEKINIIFKPSSE